MLILALLLRPSIEPNWTNLRWPMLYVTREGLALPLGPFIVKWKV